MRVALLLSFVLVGTLRAETNSKLPAANEIRSITAYPEKLVIRGSDDAPQLLITAETMSGRFIDLSADAKYQVADTKIAQILPNGRVSALGNGSTIITASFLGKTVKVPVVTAQVGEKLAINFPNQVVPVFTKLGCNSGACHGKLSGQNGFRLSLLGFEPEIDYASLLKEGRGRRVMPAAPESSLLLMKASGTMAHGGGKKMEKDSEEYKIVRRWIASGMPWTQASDPTLTKITVYPETRILSKQSRQQIIIYAHYSDGSIEDVTRRAQYDSNDPDIARIDPSGVVSILSLTGEAAIMARFQGQVTAFRATVPYSSSAPPSDFEPKNFIDELAQKKWQRLGLAPSELCTDQEFLRRAYLDITGTLPTPKQINDFLASSSKDKRDRLVDELLETNEYSYLFANKWADILRVKRGNQGNQTNRATGTFAFHTWIRDAILQDKPYDQFVKDILGAIGDENKNPPTVWYKDLATPEQFVDNVSQVFLGLRIACANCHHHPYEKWGQDDYWGMASFFSRTGRKSLPVPGANNNNQSNRQVIYTMANGTVINRRTTKVAPLKPLDGEVITGTSEIDPRVQLAEWMAQPENPYFAKAVANRYWAHFFGRGIVDALDDMRVTNPPSNPELLDALAQHLIEKKFSLKSLIATICKSQVYQLSSTPNESNKTDKQAYARYYPRRMTAEVLFDALCQATDSPSKFTGMPSDKFAPSRAIMLPDESFASYFLDVFGRPQRISACECERVTEANLAQTLHLLNSEEVQGKLNRASGRCDQLATDKRPDEEKIEELFLWTIGHKPSEKQMNLALENIEKHAKKKKDAYENILWALLNSKEFLFNR